MKWTFMILLSSLLTAAGVQLQGCSVTAEEGETVILPVNLNLTQDSKLSTPTIWWKKEAEEVVHQHQNKQDYHGNQNERFKGRTSLFQEEINKGNVSLKIINVTKNDTGEYTCDVLQKDPKIEKTYNVSLCVEEKDEHGGPGQIAGIVIGVLVVLAALISVFLYKECKGKPKGNEGPAGEEENNEKDTLELVDNQTLEEEKNLAPYFSS